MMSSLTTFGKSVADKSHFEFSLDTLKLFDKNRQREIPIAIYKPTTKVSKKQKSKQNQTHYYSTQKQTGKPERTNNQTSDRHEEKRRHPRQHHQQTAAMQTYLSNFAPDIFKQNDRANGHP